MQSSIVKTAHKQAQIFGVSLTGTSKVEVLRFVRNFLRSFDKLEDTKTPFFIVTPNPEQILMTQEDQTMSKILNSADVSLPDGIGLIHAIRFLSLPNCKIKLFRPFLLLFQGLEVGLATFIARDWLNDGFGVIKGREVFMALIALANKKGWRVALLGDRFHSARLAQSALEVSYKQVRLFSFDGPNVNKEGEVVSGEDVRIEKEAVEGINKVRPHLLFVGFGAPKQEKWVNAHLSDLSVGGVMVVGKSFEWISGHSKLTPEWMGKIGLEWLWRLLTGSTNLRRIWKAVIVFPWKVFVYKLGL